MIKNFEEMLDAYHPTPYNHSARSVIEHIFDYLDENQQVCKPLLLNQSNATFLEKLMTLLTGKAFTVEQELYGGRQTELVSCQLTFLAYGVLGILRKWFSEGSTFSKSEIVEAVDKTINVFLAF